MNSGAEANETIKLARKWGYAKKGIPENQAVIVALHQNFHGRTTTIISASSDPSARNGFGPFMPGFEIVAYDSVDALEKALANPRNVRLWMEPIQEKLVFMFPMMDTSKQLRNSVVKTRCC